MNLAWCVGLFVLLGWACVGLWWGPVALLAVGQVALALATLLEPPGRPPLRLARHGLVVSLLALSPVGIGLDLLVRARRAARPEVVPPERPARAERPVDWTARSVRLRDVTAEALAARVEEGLPALRELTLGFERAPLTPGHLAALAPLAPQLETLRLRAQTRAAAGLAPAPVDAVLAAAGALRHLELDGVPVGTLTPRLPTLASLRLRLADDAWLALDALDAATALSALDLSGAPAHVLDPVARLPGLRRLHLDLIGTPRWTLLASLRPAAVALHGHGLDDALLAALAPTLFARVGALRLVSPPGEVPHLDAGLVQLLDECPDLGHLQLSGFTVGPAAAARLRGRLPASTDVQVVEPVPPGLLPTPGVRLISPLQRGWSSLP